MSQRRTLLRQLGAAAVAGRAVGCDTRPAAGAGRTLDRVGVQLYTVRTAMEVDLERTLERIAAIGYTEVEFAGLFGRPARELRALLDAHGLTAPAGHVDLTDLRSNPEAVFEAASELGHRFVVVAWLNDPDRASLDAYRRTATAFNDLGVAARSAGLAFAYHNHAFELERMEGRVPYDVLLESTDPGLVAFEMDLFWMVQGGGDPLRYFQDHPGRFRMVHVKDRSRTGEMVDVGAGRIDFARIFAQAGAAGIEHYFVEHDNPGEDPFQSIRVSYDYLAQLEF